MDDLQFLEIRETSEIDFLDENLYSYDSAVFDLTPAIYNRTSENLLSKIEQFIDSVPALQNVAENLKSKTEYIPRLDLLSDEIRQALQSGTAEMIPCKDASDAFYLQIRTTVKGLIVNGKEYGMHKKLKDIPLGTKQVPTDVVGAMQCLSMQSQLNQIADGLREISEACEYNFGRMIQGQRDDRLAKLLSSRSCYIQALAVTDENLRRQMLTHAIRDANLARAELAFQIKSDIIALGGEKSPKAKDMEKMVSDINTAVIAMNNAVQLSLYSFQALGEQKAQLSVVKEHETFVKQVLLKEIEYKKVKYIAWDLICSSGNSESIPQEFYSIPLKLVNNCVTFIDAIRQEKSIYLEEKING